MPAPYPFAGTCSVFLALTDPVSLTVAVDITVGPNPGVRTISGLQEFYWDQYSANYDSAGTSHQIALYASYARLSFYIAKLLPAQFESVDHAVREAVGIVHATA